MNGFNSIRLAIDTNIIFMAWYNSGGKCAQVLRKAWKSEIKLFSTDTVKEEIVRVFRRHKLDEEEINNFLSDLSIEWIEKDFYIKFIDKAKVKHKPDKPIEALVIALGCKVLSADKHFKNRVDVKELGF